MNKKLLNALEKQKSTRDSIKKQSFFTREKLTKLKEVFDTPLVKVITGPRRAGKSSLVFLLLKNYDFIYVNFEDNVLLKEVEDENELMDHLKYVYGDIKLIFFDEIQNFPNWEMFLNKLHREGYNIFITGSNANLLSGELATSLTGRHLALEVLPFSFSEYLNTLDEKIETEIEMIKKQKLILYKGGFPEIILNTQDSFPFNDYIELLVWSIIHKDISSRYNIKNTSYITKLVEYIISNTTNKLNYSTISSILNIKTYRTVIKYLGYLDNSYLFSFLSGFSFKAKKRITSNNKIYVIDNAILMYKNFFNSISVGILFENLVFVELLKKNYKANHHLFYYITKNNYEVDFILKKNIYETPFALIQVCYDISNDKTEKREVRALLEASDELKCDNLFIITYDLKKEISVSGKTIYFTPFSDFALTDFVK